MDMVSLFRKQLNLTYTRLWGENRTLVDGMLMLSPSHRLSATHAFGSRNCNLRYSFVHKGMTTFEPSYDLASNSWNVSMSTRVLDGDLVRASYQTSDRILDLELITAQNFKVSVYGQHLDFHKRLFMVCLLLFILLCSA